MPRMVPVQAVHVGRPHPQGRKNRHGDVIHQSVRPQIGEPFDFTDEELEDIRRSNPAAIREPINEGQPATAVTAEVDLAGETAAEQARAGRAAPDDARRVARTAATGRGARKQPDNTDQGEAPGSDAAAAGEGEDEEL